MRIELDVDTKELLLSLSNGQRRLAEATVRAINKTALRIQQEEFQNIRNRFYVRKEQFFFGTPSRPGGVAARIKPFASVKAARPYAEVGVATLGKNQTGRNFLLAFYEAGATKDPRSGSKNVAVPLTGRARPSMRDKVSPEFTFAGMKLIAYTRKTQKLYRTLPSGYRTTVRLSGKAHQTGLPTDVQWRGANRTFLLRSTFNFPHGGIFQRVGKGRGASGVRAVWKFQPTVQLDNRLRFIPIASATTATWYKEELERQVILALKRSRAQGL